MSRIFGTIIDDFLPDFLTYEDGAMIACGFGTAYQGLLRANVSGRDRVLVMGLGPVGQAALILAKAMGAETIGVDISEERLEMAKKIGAVQEPAGNKAPAKAAPEDLQKIVAGWRVITGQTTGMFKQMLQKSVPKYNSETGEPVLYVEFQDFLGQSYVDNPEAKKELQDIITAQTGKTVEIQMLVADKHQHTNLANITVDQAIKNNIHMDVVIEEDPDEEKGE